MSILKSKVLMLFLFSLFMIIITDLFVDNRAYAHNQDYLPGRYLSTSRCNQTGLKLRIKESAQKTFIHEVGHALKLAHPVMGTSSIGHYNSGYPVAVMNQGLPNGSYISSTITTHDIQNLQGKWGN